MELTQTEIFLVFLPYGAVFFAIGVAITSRRKIFIHLKIAGLFWLLAMFAFSHSLHEWLEMYRHLQLTDNTALLMNVRYVSLVMALTSFLFLFMFGVSLISALLPTVRRWFLLVFLLILGLFAARLLTNFFWADYFVREYDMRLLIALPATLLTATAFFIYARQLTNKKVRGANSFFGAGCAFLAYGIFTGAIPSGTVLLLPVEAWRGLSAFVILHFLMYALDSFMDQREEMITDQLQLAANSEKLSAIGRLAAGVAHEINNPLANASLQLEMLRQHSEISILPEKITARLQAIEKSIDKSSHIARELLLFAGGKTPDTPFSTIAISGVIDSAWQMASYKSKQHQLHNNLLSDLSVKGNRIKLEELFLNLFLNAIDAMPDQGTIEINGREEADQVIIQVLDTGSSIAVENLDLVMEPFFTTKEVGQGTGLGLSICYGIMKLHGGSINIAPRKNTNGACVTLKFPLDGAKNQERAHTA